MSNCAKTKEEYVQAWTQHIDDLWAIYPAGEDIEEFKKAIDFLKNIVKNKELNLEGDKK